MLEEAYNIYASAGEAASASFCLEKMKTIPLLLQEADTGTSKLGCSIRDLPELDFPAEYQTRLDRLLGK